ncbi:interferon-related developmental regulator-domain-containing protein [Pestalotiopsis sp. NC0098]|nr:interferon-related developmental regulator-domain-containing protein [Pestalotiopsis sp. NC0098]
MRDLRKKILLESGKTVSRKARTRPDSNFGSTTHSPTSSAAGSRAPSRYASEDEVSDDDPSDSLTNSVIASEDGEDTVSDWTDKLKDCINEILDRKRSSTQGRERYFAAYTHLARHHFADTMIDHQIHELVPAFLRSIRGGHKDETVGALKALQMTTITTQSDSIYDQAFSILKSATEGSDEESVKVEALYTMAVATIFGGGAEVAAQELMDFAVEIVESDGHSVEAGDNGPVVTAALIIWGFLASHIDELEQQSEEALEAFTEQLDSSDADVQIAAGSNIALIFEALRIYNEQAEEDHDSKQEQLRVEAKQRGERYNPEPYNPFDLQYNQHQLVQKMTELAGQSSKTVSRKDRRQLHSTFNSILKSLELGKGPGYSEAGRIARESDRGGERVFAAEKVFTEFGYRNTVKGNDGRTLTIDSWSLSIRVDFLKRILGGGFTTHWSHNPAVAETFDSA